VCEERKGKKKKKRANDTSSFAAVKLRSGPGMIHAAKTAQEIFSGNLSIATELLSPPIL
jgi:hypothetical protein